MKRAIDFLYVCVACKMIMGSNLVGNQTKCKHCGCQDYQMDVRPRGVVYAFEEERA
jgi:rRNA maturation endonuclease Nob1